MRTITTLADFTQVEPGELLVFIGKDEWSDECSGFFVIIEAVATKPEFYQSENEYCYYITFDGEVVYKTEVNQTNLDNYHVLVYSTPEEFVSNIPPSVFFHTENNVNDSMIHIQNTVKALQRFREVTHGHQDNQPVK